MTRSVKEILVVQALQRKVLPNNESIKDIDAAGYALGEKWRKSVICFFKKVFGK